MDTPQLQRRMLLRGAGVAGASMVGLAAATAPALARDDHHHDSHDPLGSWLITHTNKPADPTDPGTSVVGFAAGGMLVTQDLSPLGVAGVGSWEAEDGGRFTATFWSAFPGENNGTGGLLKFTVRGKVDHDDVSGTFRGTAYDTKMKQLDTFEGTFKGSRIEP